MKYTKQECLAARRYLRTHGRELFLQQYLPSHPKGVDILNTIYILGFTSLNCDTTLDSEQSLITIIRVLNRAMDKILSSVKQSKIESIDELVKLIQKSKKVLVLTGAGISTSLGIPDFRSSAGIYSKVQDLGLNDPQEVFDLAVFRENPDIFYSVAHLILPPENSYTYLHSFIKRLNDEGKLLRNYTQNIDNLESNVDLPASKVIQCHGSFAFATCQSCGWKCEGSRIFKYIKEKVLPVCPNCLKERKRLFTKNEYYQPASFGLMKPDITFFGEQLPEAFHSHILSDVAQCDLLLCIGTSLKVSPVSSIVNLVPENVPQILINKDLIGHCGFDMSLLGYCDDAALLLAEKLGWEIQSCGTVTDRSKKPISATVIDSELSIYEVKADEAAE